MLELYLLKIDLQLFGDQHRDRCICALTHFDVRHDKSDPTVRRDPHESIGLEGLIHARLSFGERGRQAQACIRPPPVAAPTCRKLRRRCGR